MSHILIRVSPFSLGMIRPENLQHNEPGEVTLTKVDTNDTKQLVFGQL